MFGPDLQEIAPESKENIYHQIYRKTQVLVGIQHMFRMNARILNTLLSAYGLPVLVEKPFVDFFFRGNRRREIPSPELSIQDLDTGVKLFVKVVHWGYGSFLRTFRALGTERDIAGTLRDFPLKELRHFDARREKLRGAPDIRLEELSPEGCKALGYTIVPPEGIDIDDARKKSRLNSEAYLFCEDIDIYLAGSMREGEFGELIDFSQQLRQHFEQSGLNPVVFDPTICWYDAATDKGLLEALMLKRASIGVMVAGQRDSFGKDSEVAHLLAQGKPVVVFCRNPEDVPDEEEKKELVRRFELYQNVHPLRIQVSPFNGVAYGLIAVKDQSLCFEVIDDLLLHNLETDLDYNYEHGNGEPGELAGSGDATALIERGTESVLRVITKNPSLTRAFWNRYFERQVPAENTDHGRGRMP